MSTRSRWAVLALFALPVCTSCGGSEPAQAPASVLLVTLDTTRPDHLSCYGYGRPTTPEIDRLAARGTVFLNAWSQAPTTGPSIASALTSRRAPVTGVRGNAERLREGVPTLAHVASAADRRTAAFVSAALLRRDVCGLGGGFATYDDEMTDPCFGHAKAQRIAARTVDRALAWLRESDEPFVLWVHLYDPHGPYVPPDPMLRLDGSTDRLPDGPVDRRKVPPYQRLDGDPGVRDYVDRYDREIAYMDRELGRLFAAVDPATTVVAVHADHGEGLGEDDYWFRHGALLHDPGLRIPLVLAGPGVPAGQRIEHPVRNLDLAPTLLSLAGVAPLPDAEGVDLAPWLRGEARAPRFEAIAEARYREDLFDSTGIDTRWKLRFRTDGIDVTWWPADDRVRGTADPAARERALAAMRAWIDEPPSEPSRRKAPEQTPEQLEALRSLGYR
jgi:arylsulfatase A-like enzyme